LNLSTLFSPIQGDLDLVETQLRDSLKIEFAPLTAIFETLIGSGGKRLRPALTVLAGKFHPGLEDRVRTLAVATELIHAATLIHDDFIDKSPLRRGSPTVNTKWSGTATVLAGDFLLARAAYVAASVEDFRVMRLFAEMLMIICEGEIRQDFGRAQFPPNEKDYYRHIESKTAALFRASTEGGAVLSRAPEDEIQALKRFGQDLGMAFQIVDDILDFVADESKLGKPVGSDLRQGTLTLPVLYFIERDARGAQVQKILERNGQGSVAEMDELIESIRTSASMDAAKTRAQEFARSAQNALTILPDNEFRRALHDLTAYVVERSL
jgi:geranylgeranyl pyrophosphate synthase